MLATLLHGPRDVRVEERPDPRLVTGDDAVVRVVAACVCGSDLWRYRGIVDFEAPKLMGHEFVGVVEQVGDDVHGIRVGDVVIAPFYVCDMTCVHCRGGVSTSCVRRGGWGFPDDRGVLADGAQAERVRVPVADGTLVRVPEGVDVDALLPDLLALSDVCGTGHHAAVSAGVGSGKTVAVVGDGAVGLMAVLAASRLGAERVIAFSRYPDRQALAREFGATDILEERGREGAKRVHELTGIGADCVLECVGTRESIEQAVRSARPGGAVGYVGVPGEGPAWPAQYLFSTNIRVAGGVAPVRQYLPDLLDDVIAGRIRPGRVFDFETTLDGIAEAYAAMDERRSIKALVRMPEQPASA